MLCKTSSKNGTSKITKYCACRKCDLSFCDLSDAFRARLPPRVELPVSPHTAPATKKCNLWLFCFLVFPCFIVFPFLLFPVLWFSLVFFTYFSDLYFLGPAFFSLLYLSFLFAVILKLQNSEVSQLNFRWIKWCVYIYIHFYIYMYISLSVSVYY